MPGGWEVAVAFYLLWQVSTEVRHLTINQVTGNYMFNGNERVVEESTAKLRSSRTAHLFCHRQRLYITNSYGHRVGHVQTGRFQIDINSFPAPVQFCNGDFEERSDFATDNISATGQNPKLTTVIVSQPRKFQPDRKRFSFSGSVWASPEGLFHSI